MERSYSQAVSALGTLREEAGDQGVGFGILVSEKEGLLLVVPFGYAPSQADVNAILGDVHPSRKPAPSSSSSWGPQASSFPLCHSKPTLAETGSPVLRRRGPGSCLGSLLVLHGKARGPSDFFAVLMDQGRGRSVAPTRPILRPQTRYKGRGVIGPGPLFVPALS